MCMCMMYYFCAFSQAFDAATVQFLYNCACVCASFRWKKPEPIDNKFKEETANAFKFKIKDAVDVVATHAFVP